MGDEIKLTTGVISSKTGFQGDVSLYQISAPIQPGNSGGPLFDNKGYLVGIVNAKHVGAENVGYAIKSSNLLNLIESSVSSSILPTSNTIYNLPLTSKVKAVKNFVFMIKCSSQSQSSNKSTQQSYNEQGKLPNVNSTNTVYWPTVRTKSASAAHAKIKSVTLEKEYTAVEIIANNKIGDSYADYCYIDKNTYLSVSGATYTITKAEGIKIAPEKTYFSYQGEEIIFTLYFPPIPTSATEMNLREPIESGDGWNFYGIKIR